MSVYMATVGMTRFHSGNWFQNLKGANNQLKHNNSLPSSAVYVVCACVCVCVCVRCPYFPWPLPLSPLGENQGVPKPSKKNLQYVWGL